MSVHAGYAAANNKCSHGETSGVLWDFVLAWQTESSPPTSQKYAPKYTTGGRPDLKPEVQ